MAKRKYTTEYRKAWTKYKKDIKKLEDRYGEEPEERITDFYEFKRTYIVEKERMAKGEIKKVNVAKKIAEDSFYEFSYRESRMIRKYAEEQGIDTKGIKISDIRRGLKHELEDAFYESITDYRRTMLNSGMSSKEIAADIAIRYFDSDPKKYGRSA